MDQAHSEPAKILLRVPRDLHARLKARAAEEGVSVNTLMAALLAGAIGWRLEPEHESGAAPR